MKKKIYEWITKSTRPSPTEHAKELLISLMFNSDTEYQINTFEALKELFGKELLNKENKALKEFNLINKYLPVAKKVSMIDINDPIFEQPIKKQKL